MSTDKTLGDLLNLAHDHKIKDASLMLIVADMLIILGVWGTYESATWDRCDC